MCLLKESLPAVLGRDCGGASGGSRETRWEAIAACQIRGDEVRGGVRRGQNLDIF